MSLAPQAPPQRPQGAPGPVQALNGLSGGLLDNGLGQQGLLSPLGGQQGLLSPLDGQQAAGALPAASAAAGASPALTALGSASLLGAAQPPSADALQQQLAALQQQQALAQALADPLLSLQNLLAAQQGLSARVQELLLLKQSLQVTVPQRSGGIRGTGPIANPLYKVRGRGRGRRLSGGSRAAPGARWPGHPWTVGGACARGGPAWAALSSPCMLGARLGWGTPAWASALSTWALLGLVP